MTFTFARATPVALLCGLAGFAGAQTQPAASPTVAPASIAPVPQLPEPTEPGPYVKQTDVKHWTLKTTIRLTRSPDLRNQKLEPFQYDMPFETMTIVFPLLPDTSSASLRVQDARGTLRLNETDVVDGLFAPAGSTIAPGLFPRPPEVLERHYTSVMYHSGTRFAKFAFGDKGSPREVRKVGLTLDLPMRTSNTEFDEEAALRVPWPQGPWPEAAASTFAPQPWVDFLGPSTGGNIKRFNEELFSTLITRWLNGQDPKANFTPVGLAKTLVAGMLNDITPDRNFDTVILDPSRPKDRKHDGSSNDPRDGKIYGEDRGLATIGMQLRGAEFAASQPGVSEWDMAALGCAIFRRCGLPTRLVLGLDRREEESKDQGRDLSPKPRAWFEFYLYDETRNTGNWVICDPYRMRKSMAKAPPLHQKWKFFGTHDEMESVLPFAMHFTPPTDVAPNSAVSFWGWWVTPQAPANVATAITMTARKTAVPKDATKKR